LKVIKAIIIINTSTQTSTHSFKEKKKEIEEVGQNTARNERVKTQAHKPCRQANTPSK